MSLSENSGTVEAVRKAVAVLFAVSEGEGPVSLSEVARKTGVPVATARRLLMTLVGASLVRREGKGYTLGVRAFEIGKKAEKKMDLIEIARPHLRRLSDETGENANLAVLDNTDVVYLSCEECSKMVRAFTVTGARVPAHATGVGKVLLAGLSDGEIEALYRGVELVKFTARTVSTLSDLLREVRKARELGFAFDEGEREEGVLCVAAPVREYGGQVKAAVSVSGPSTRLDRQRVLAQGRTLECASAISRHLGCTT